MRPGDQGRQHESNHHQDPCNSPGLTGTEALFQLPQSSLELLFEGGGVNGQVLFGLDHKDTFFR